MRQKQQARADQKERKQSKDGPRTTPLAVGTQRRLRRSGSASAPTFVTNASAVAGQQTSDLAADSALSRPRALVGASCSTAGGRTTCR